MTWIPDLLIKCLANNSFHIFLGYKAVLGNISYVEFLYKPIFFNIVFLMVLLSVSLFLVAAGLCRTGTLPGRGALLA